MIFGVGPHIRNSFQTMNMNLVRILDTVEFLGSGRARERSAGHRGEPPPLGRTVSRIGSLA